MTTDKIADDRQAASQAQQTLRELEDKLGFVPNVFGVLGDTPNILQALATMNACFAQGGLDEVEREIVQLAVSVVNGCGYCVAGHTAFATALGMPEVDIDALRQSRPLADPRHEALRRFATTLAAGKGRGAAAEHAAFRAAGYSHAQTLDVVLGTAVKVFTNTLAILLRIPADDAFRPYAWVAPTAEAPQHTAAA